MKYPERRARFLTQARRAAMLQHRSIEEVYDLIDHDNVPTIVSEWVDGRSLQRLASWMRRSDRSWDPTLVAVIAESLLNALRHAHRQLTHVDARGVLHGGIWPGNVLIDVGGRVKLVDFGLAAVWQRADEPWQDLEAMRYLSAAHLRQGASAASDLHSVGALVHELLSDHLFRERYETEADMRTAIESATPPPLARETPLESVRCGLLGSITDATQALERALDQCSNLSADDARERLGTLVAEALRDDNPVAEPAAPEDPSDDDRDDRMAGRHTAADSPPDTLARLGLRRGRRRKRRGPITKPVAVPRDHELTAKRTPVALLQTRPARGATARDAERRRSGNDEPETPRAVPEPIAEVDTAPLADAEPEDPETESSRRQPGLVPGETAEVDRIPLLPEDRAATALSPTLRRGPRLPLPAWARLRGPLGYVLLGAALVAIGGPVVARCGPPDPAATPASSAPSR